MRVHFRFEQYLMFLGWLVTAASYWVGHPPYSGICGGFKLQTIANKFVCLHDQFITSPLALGQFSSLCLYILIAEWFSLQKCRTGQYEYKHLKSYHLPKSHLTPGQCNEHTGSQELPVNIIFILSWISFSEEHFYILSNCTEL